MTAPKVLHQAFVVGLLPQSLELRIGGIAAHPVGHPLQHRGLTLEQFKLDPKKAGK